MKEKQIKRNDIYEGKVVHLVCDDVELEDGRTAKREVVLHNGGAAIALKDDDGKYFLVKQYRYALGKEMLEACAGKLEKGEKPDDAIARECKEELGYEVKELKSLGQMIPTCGYCNEIIYLYHGLKGEYVGQHFDADENLNVVKLSLEEIKEKILSGEIDDSKIISLAYKIEMAGL